MKENAFLGWILLVIGLLNGSLAFWYYPQPPITDNLNFFLFLLSLFGGSFIVAIGIGIIKNGLIEIKTENDDE